MFPTQHLSFSAKPAKGLRVLDLVARQAHKGRKKPETFLITPASSLWNELRWQLLALYGLPRCCISWHSKRKMQTGLSHQ